MPMKGVEGMILECHRDGRVAFTVHDSLGLCTGIRLGEPFSIAVCSDSFAKLMNLFAAINKKEPQYGWEINVTVSGSPQTLFVSGSLLHERIFLLITRAQPKIENFMSMMMEVSNEQTNLVRALNQNHRNAGPNTGPSLTMEFSRLNSELTNIQRETIKANAELKRVSEQKSIMLGVAAHDLRTPLGVISGYAEFHEYILGDRIEKKELNYIQHIRQSSAAMQKMIENLLNLSSIESGRLMLDRSPVNMVELLEQCIGFNAPIGARKGITLNLNISEGLPIMVIDGQKISQVLENLVNNAIKYSRPNTNVEIAAHCTDELMQIIVSDEGPGIHSHEINALFKPFGKTSNRPTGGEISTGLGLVICKNIVEGHGGQITVSSQVGKGTTMAFTIPKPSKL